MAVVGYGISALAKPLFCFTNTWGGVAGVRWADRVGKGIRTAPRDALVADSSARNSADWPSASTVLPTQGAPCWSCSSRCWSSG